MVWIVEEAEVGIIYVLILTGDGLTSVVKMNRNSEGTLNINLSSLSCSLMHNSQQNAGEIKWKQYDKPRPINFIQASESPLPAELRGGREMS
jgi:hypothetical protein